MNIDTINTFAKYSGIMICTLYVYTKIMRLQNIKKILVFAFIISSSILSLVIDHTRMSLPFLPIPLIVIFVSIFFVLSSKAIRNIDANYLISAAIISTALSYFLFFICSIIVVFIFHIFGLTPDDALVYATIGSAIMTLFVAVLLFKIKRLRNGMPFLSHKPIRTIGEIVAGISLFGAMMIKVSINITEDLNFIVISMMVVACSLIILYWWRTNITTIYHNRLVQSELDALEKLILEKDAQLEKIKEDNFVLTRIIHRDNKMIPAMEYALRSYLEMDGHDKEKAKDFLAQLDLLSQERIGIIKAHDISTKKFPLTDITSVDMLISYMYRKSLESDIAFDVAITGDIRTACDERCNRHDEEFESDLSTLVADLIENAMIATKTCEKRYVLVCFGVSEGHLHIDFCDSGSPFDSQVLAVLGQRQITTHAADGGSGIGLMSSTAILNKYNGRLLIDEMDSDVYTKKVSVWFD
ncbi:MAG: GHKL domain-containing protein [Clostridiales Family XIII bacterium]|nr:GHKL domain-containing protein [Clostridiales Family XIII bacterium]